MNKVLNIDCIEYMKSMAKNSVDFILTDIPYGEVSRDMGGLCNYYLNLGDADEVKFNLTEFCEEVYRITKNSVCIFCGREQFSYIYSFFTKKKGTTRPIVWEKSNPVPMNGQYVYLSGVEFAVWFKKAGAKTFNAHCKNTVFKYPITQGKYKIHPTQKNKNLFIELIKDNSNEGNLIFDPCAGGMTTAMAALETNRKFLCCELNKDFYERGIEYLEKNYHINLKNSEIPHDNSV